MNTVIRCHIKNDKRLETFRRTLQSWKDKELNELGELIVVDDQSPMREQVVALANEFNAKYILTEPPGDTKNGLYASLKAQTEFPVLCCVDDMVFGRGTKDRLKTLLDNEYRFLDRVGMIGMFACYDLNVRLGCQLQKVPDVWKVPIDILYALVCHLFSEELSEVLIKEWEGVRAGTVPYPGMCDDIWAKEVCRRERLNVYNTFIDFAWHTGAFNRTFTDDPIGNSNYQTPRFIGE